MIDTPKKKFISHRHSLKLMINHEPIQDYEFEETSTKATLTLNSIASKPTSPTKPHPFYQNLLEMVKRDKSADVLPSINSKKPLQKSKTHEKDLRKKSTDAFQKRSQLIKLPTGVGLHHNLLQISLVEKTRRDEIETVRCEEGSSKPGRSFINRFNSLKEDAESKPKKTDDALLGHPFRHLIFDKNSKITKKDFFAHLKSVQKGLVYAKKHIIPPDEKKISPKTVPLDPLPDGMKTLVLDLDGTLVHIADHKNVNQSHVTLKMKNEQGDLKTFGIRFRPYLYYFLEKLYKNYEIIVFTSSQASYASAVVEYIDPERKFIKYVISRDGCLVTKNGFYIKDLRILANRDLKDVLIVDNLTHNFCLQIDNGIPILNYKDDPDDKELKYLAEHLLKCAESNNLQEFNGRSLKLEDLVDYELNDR